MTGKKMAVWEMVEDDNIEIKLNPKKKILKK